MNYYPPHKKLACKIANAKSQINFLENSRQNAHPSIINTHSLHQNSTDIYYSSLLSSQQKSTLKNSLFESHRHNNWHQDLLETLKNIPPASFEKLAQKIMYESGFVSVDVTGKSKDGGIDGKGVLNINLISFQVFFQCKRYSGVVGSPDLRDFRGAMQGRGDKGLFITTGVFSTEAKREATRDGAPTIDLIDGNELCQLLKNLQLGVKTEMVEQVTVSPDYFVSI